MGQVRKNQRYVGITFRLIRKDEKAVEHPLNFVLSLYTVSPWGHRNIYSICSIQYTLIRVYLFFITSTRPPRPVNPRDFEIYGLHNDEKKTIRELSVQFGLSETRLWGICTVVRKRMFIAS
jgi:hypothetical protein